MDVVGGHKSQAEFFGQFDLAAVGRFLIGQIGVMLDFQKEIFFAEKFDIAARGRFGFVEFFVDYQPRDFALDASRHGNQSLAVLGQQFVVHAGFVIKTFQMRLGYQFDQVFVAQFVFGQQHQVIADIVDFGPALETAFHGRVDFAADDRLDSAGLGFFIKFHRAIHVAVVSESD